MVKIKLLIFMLVLSLSLLFFGCSKKEVELEKRVQSKFSIVTVNYPIFTFTKKIVGNLVDVKKPFSLDEDPAFWEPSDSEIIKIQNSNLILQSGGNYAKWITKIDIPNRKLVDCSIKLENKLLKNKIGITHSHGPSGAHSHGVIDFNIWLNPNYAKSQAKTILDAVSKKIPNKSATFLSNYTKLEVELDNLVQKIEIIKELLKNKERFYLQASHPVYGYLAQAINLDVKSFHWEPNLMPNDNEIEIAIERSKLGNSVMLWEDEPLAELRNLLEKAGMQIVVFNPCGNVPSKGTYFSKMGENFDDLIKAVE